MSTHSQIGILNRDKSITSIYCHWDGYLDHVGRILKEYYDTEEKVKELIALGSLSTLYPKIKPDPDKSHNFDNPAPDTTVAYHRDLGEPWNHTKPETHRTKTNYIMDMKNRCISEIYLFNPKDSTWRHAVGQQFRKYKTEN